MKLSLLMMFFFIVFVEVKGQLPDFNMIMHYEGGLSIATEILRTKDKGYIIFGKLLVSGSSNYDVYIMKFNERLEQVWGKRIGSLDEEWSRFVKMDSEENLYFGIGSRTWGKGVGISTNLIKLTSEGEFLWGKTFQEGNFNIMDRGTLIGDSLIYIAGSQTTVLPAPLVPSGNTIFNIVSAVALNTDGELKYFKLLKYDFECNSTLSVAPNGELVLFSTTTEDSQDGQSDLAREYATRLDHKGEPLWSKEYISDVPLVRLRGIERNSIVLENDVFWNSIQVGENNNINKEHLWAFGINGRDGSLKKALSLHSNIFGYSLANINNNWKESTKSIDSLYLATSIKNDMSGVNIGLLTKIDTSFTGMDHYIYDDNDGDKYLNFFPLYEENEIVLVGSTINDAKDLNGDVLWGMTGFDKDCRLRKLVEEEEAIIMEDVTSRTIVNDLVPEILNSDSYFSLNFTDIDVFEDFELEYTVRTCEPYISILNGDTLFMNCDGQDVVLRASTDVKYSWFQEANPDVILSEESFLTLSSVEADTRIIVEGYSGKDTIVVIDTCEAMLIEEEEDCEIYIYKEYTPNNDGLNECFRIKNLEKFERNEIKLYNELGHKVWGTTNYENDTYCFDDLEDGVYLLYVGLPNGTEYHETIVLLH